MKISKTNPYIENPKYTLKEEKIIALNPQDSLSLSKKAGRNSHPTPTIDERFITRRFYETNCSRMRQIGSIFASLLLLPLFEKQIRLGIFGKKTVRVYTFSTKEERSSKSVSFHNMNHMKKDVENARDLLIAEKYNGYNQIVKEKYSQLSREVNQAIEIEDPAEKAQKAQELMEKSEKIDQEFMALTEEMFSMIDRTQKAAISHGTWQDGVSSTPLRSIFSDHVLDKLLNVAKKRLSNKPFNEMDALDKRMWKLIKKETIDSLHIFRSMSGTKLYSTLRTQFTDKKEYLKDLYQSHPEPQFQIQLAALGIDV